MCEYMHSSTQRPRRTTSMRQTLCKHPPVINMYVFMYIVQLGIITLSSVYFTHLDFSCTQVFLYVGIYVYS